MIALMKPKNTNPILRFEGTNSTGVAAGGTTVSYATPAALAERMFAAGWRVAKVVRDGILVGGIAPHPDTQARTWWGDRS